MWQIKQTVLYCLSAKLFLVPSTINLYYSGTFAYSALVAIDSQRKINHFNTWRNKHDGKRN